jgi:hypothetical protein
MFTGATLVGWLGGLRTTHAGTGRGHGVGFLEPLASSSGGTFHASGYAAIGAISWLSAGERRVERQFVNRLAEVGRRVRFAVLRTGTCSGDPPTQSIAYE